MEFEIGSDQLDGLVESSILGWAPGEGVLRGGEDVGDGGEGVGQVGNKVADVGKEANKALGKFEVGGAGEGGDGLDALVREGDAGGGESKTQVNEFPNEEVAFTQVDLEALCRQAPDDLVDNQGVEVFTPGDDEDVVAVEDDQSQVDEVR